MIVFEESEIENIKIDQKELEISYYKDSGAGGQHRNKTMSGVRLKYKDIIVTCCNTRDQRKNKEIAFLKLKKNVYQKKWEEENNRLNEVKSSQNQNKGKRGNFKRNYNFLRDELTQDGEKFSLKKFLRGDLSKIYGA